MVELILRGLIALSVGLAAAIWPDFTGPIGWQVSIGFLALAFTAYGLEFKEKRNAGASGIIAVVDAMYLATILAAQGSLDRYGFIVLAPMLWATGRFAADAASMSPLVAATVMVSSNFFGGDGFTIPVLLHTAGIFVIGLLTNQAKVIVKETQIPYEVTKEVPVLDPATGRIKESYQSLRDHVQELERLSRRDRLSMKLWNSAHGATHSPLSAMAAKLSEEASVEGLILYSLDPAERRLVVANGTGRVPENLRDRAFEFPSGLGDAQIRHEMDKQMRSLRDSDRLVHLATVLLKHKGRPVGLVALFDPSRPAVEEAFTTVHELNEAMGGLVKQALDRDDERRRLRETELMYGVASVSLGAESRQNLIARVVRELSEAVTLDHLAVWLLDGTEATLVSSSGATNRVFEKMSFAQGPGVGGWLLTGAPEVVALDALEDGRIDRKESLLARVGSFVMFPLLGADGPIGFLTASTHSVGGIDRAKHETIRVIASELAQALNRLDTTKESAHGVMTPQEFANAVRAGGSGHFVYFEVPRRSELADEYGKPAVEAALKRITHRLRIRLPGTGGLCRRDEGDYVAFIPIQDTEQARRWANDTVGLLNGLNLATSDGRQKLPLTLRAKVAPFSPQKNQVSEANAA